MNRITSYSDCEIGVRQLLEDMSDATVDDLTQYLPDPANYGVWLVRRVRSADGRRITLLVYTKDGDFEEVTE